MDPYRFCTRIKIPKINWENIDERNDRWRAVFLIIDGWCKLNCSGEWKAAGSRVSFELEEDAILFHMSHLKP